MRWLLAGALVLGFTSPAHAELEKGVALGARLTSLEGQTTRGGSRANLGFAAHLALPLRHHFEVGIEPGIDISGSTDYRFVYLTAPVMLRYVRPVSGSLRIRGLAGVAVGYLFKSDERFYTESYEWQSIDGVSQAHVAAILGIGADTPIRKARAFAELRFARGLTSVDDSNLAVFNQEIGLWAGYAW